MSFGTTSIDPGTSPSVAIARDTVAGVVFQRVKLVDPTEDVSTAIGNDANPQKVKPRRRGTTDYDSGRVAVTTSAVELTSTTTYIERLLLSNQSDTERTFTMTNSANAEYFSAEIVPPRSTRLIDMGSLAMAGIKVQASANGAIVVQIVGAQ